MQKRWRALNGFVFLLMAGAIGIPQSRGPKGTPLGTQRPEKSVEQPQKNPPVVLEDLEVMLEKANQAHGGRQALASVVDSVSTGNITFFTMHGPKSVGSVTLIRKGSTQVQRIVKQPNGELRQGSDGTNDWESFNGMTTTGNGYLVGSFIESQTTRSLANFLDSKARGSTVRDAGSKKEMRVVEVEFPEKDPSKPARKTRYSVEKGSSRVTGVEWVTGETTTAFGTAVPTTEAYAFSDFRTVQGVATPFRIDRYVNGVKIEETRLTSVRYNTSVKDDVFKP
jgi:hypothetical protein